MRRYAIFSLLAIGLFMLGLARGAAASDLKVWYVDMLRTLKAKDPGQAARIGEQAMRGSCWRPWQSCWAPGEG